MFGEGLLQYHRSGFHGGKYLGIQIFTKKKVWHRWSLVSFMHVLF